MMQETKKKFYVTTPIYYINDVPHIGHAYTTIGADVLARFKRMDGWDVFFLTGTDEHGQKIEKAAKERGLTPQQLTDQIVVRFQEAWKKLGITYSRFIRTTEISHKRAAQMFFEKVFKNQFIYKGHYEGWYCLPDEKFLLPSEVINEKCPDCGRPVERLKEENYFFSMSKFQNALTQYLEEHPEFVQPLSRKNELVNNFIKPGLTDVCITRSSVQWGIAAPVPEKSILYVWFDALINYLSGIGWPDDLETFHRYWPADVHLIGKDILRFHATLWPAMLLAAEIPLPKKVFGTGFITMNGQKMSKSLGNVIDPLAIADQYSPDALRYFLLREIPFGVDGDFSMESFQLRFNGDLANDLGNLIHRSLSMLERYFDGVIPENPNPSPAETELKTLATQYATQARLQIEEMAFPAILTLIWTLVKRANKYIEDSAPWKVAADSAQRARLQTILYTLMEVLRVVALALAPFMPFTAESIWSQLGFSDSIFNHGLEETEEWAKIPSGQKISKKNPLFPRIDRS
jgi:methionyl-tRNA synthetase